MATQLEQIAELPTPQRVEALLGLANLSLREAASRAGIHHMTIYFWTATGAEHREPSVDSARKFKRALATEIPELELRHVIGE